MALDDALRTNAVLVSDNLNFKRQCEMYRKCIFGSKSERLVPAPPEASNQPFLPGFEPPSTPPSPQRKTETERADGERRVRVGGGWGKLPDDLPSETRVLKLPESQMVDSLGRRLEVIGYEIFQRLAWRPSYFKIIYMREKYRVPGDTLAGIVTAPHPGDVFDSKTGKGKFDASFAAHVVVSKICDALPLYRQSKMLEREGIDVGRSTLNGIFLKTASVLTPIYAAMTAELLLREVIHSDDSPLKLLSPGDGKCKTGRIWVALAGVGPPLAVYEFTPDRKGSRPVLFFKNYKGILIADDYAGYNGLFERLVNPVSHSACWAHARRKFFDCVDGYGAEADRVLELIRTLYAVEREAKEEAGGVSEAALFEARARLRPLKSAPTVQIIFAEAERIAAAHPPQSPLAKAANYSLRIRKELSRYIYDPRLNIDNNPAENAIRTVAMGRKNYLFAGTEDGGQGLAILMSLTETCKLNGVNPQTYIEDVLERVGSTPASRVADLIPHNWKRLRAGEAAAKSEANLNQAA